MKAGKAYISSLGTTGLLIASSVLLLLVVGTIVAYDRWPASDESTEPAIVSIQESQRALRKGSLTTRRQVARAVRSERRRVAAAERRRARNRARATAAEADGTGPEIVRDPVISDLPAPDSDGAGGGSPGPDGGGGEGTAGGGGAGGGSGGSGETTRHLGDAVSNVSPQAGTAIGDVGQAVDQALGAPGPLLNP